MRFLLAFRSLAAVVLLPGTVGGYIPFRMLHASDQLHLPQLSPSSLAAAALSVVGAAVLFRCVWDFFSTGQGTLAPVDPPKRLIVGGLYRFTRNPMYNGVLAVLLGEAWLFQSAGLIRYALLVLCAFHLFVVFYEERTLEARFGESYLAYRKGVPRWGFTVHPYEERTGSTT